MKIAWTFDPFDENENLKLIAVSLLKNFFRESDSIDAVYVASNAEARLAVAFDIPVEERYSTYPQKLITEATEKSGLKNLNVEVLVEKKISLTSIAKRFINYTIQNHVDLVLIATNSRATLPRLVLGSFAETMIHLSVCDLLIFHQKTQVKNQMPKKILYGLDISPLGMRGLEKIIGHARRWDASLFLVHVPAVEFGMTSLEYGNKIHQCREELEKKLQEENIKFEIHIEFEVKPISEKILETARKEDVDLIALAAQANKLEAFMGGSITRQVLRESTLPTLVLKL